MHSSNTDAAAARIKRKRRRSTYKPSNITDSEQSRSHRPCHQTKSNLLDLPSSPPPRKKHKPQDCKKLATDTSPSCLLEAKEEKGGCDTTKPTQPLHPLPLHPLQPTTSAFSKPCDSFFSYNPRDVLEKRQEENSFQSSLLNPTKTPPVHCLFPCPSPRLWEITPPPSPSASSSMPSPLSPFLLLSNTQPASLAPTISSPCSSIEPPSQINANVCGRNPFSHSPSLFHMPLSSKSSVLRFSNPLDLLNEYNDTSSNGNSNDDDGNDDDSCDKKNNDGDKSDAGVQDDDGDKSNAGVQDDDGDKSNAGVQDDDGDHAFRKWKGSPTRVNPDNVDMDLSQMETETSRKFSLSPPNPLHLLYQVGRAVECFLSPFYKKIFQAFSRHQETIDARE